MRTGDTTKSKEFPGGNLIAYGAQNLDCNFRQQQATYFFGDDWEEAPRTTKDGGSTFDLDQQRDSYTLRRPRLGQCQVRPVNHAPRVSGSSSCSASKTL